MCPTSLAYILDGSEDGNVYPHHVTFVLCEWMLSICIDSTVSVTYLANFIGAFRLECPHCQWHSSAIGLKGTKEELQRAVENMFKGSHMEHFNQLVAQYQIVAKSELRLQEARRHTVWQCA